MCDWLQVCLSECRFQGAEWSWGWLLPFPVCSPQSARLPACSIVCKMCLNKECFTAGGAWRTGRGESHFHVAPGIPLGRGRTMETILCCVVK